MHCFRDLLTGILFILSLGEYASSFSTIDMILISLSFVSVEARAVNKPLLHAFFYAFAFNTRPGILQAANILLLFSYEIKNTLVTLAEFLRHNPDLISYYLAVLSACFLFEILAYFFAGRNIRRKLFHIASFFLFVDLPGPVFLILQHVLYGLVLLSMTALPDTIFLKFTSNKDFGKGIYSHIFLMMGLMCPSLYLTRDEYIKTLISICFMDTFASVSGMYFGSDTKSWTGFLGGQASAFIAEYIALGTVDYKYHMVIGLIECFVDVNDNVMIPICSVLYFKEWSKWCRTFFLIEHYRPDLCQQYNNYFGTPVCRCGFIPAD